MPTQIIPGFVLRWFRRPIAEGWALLLPFVLLGVLARRGWMRIGALGAAILVALALRDPERECRVCDDALAPADGRVVDIRTVRDEYLDQEMVEIAIFLALWNVHVQRAPLSGRVTHVRVDSGSFKPAMLGAASENYRQTIYFETEWGPCAVAQIAGLIARRIVRWVDAGTVAHAGDRIGMIKFGSRVTLRVPAGSEPLVQIGQLVFAGLTPVARRSTPSA